jgi:hypothetical protein
MRGHTILGKVNPRQGMDCPARLPYNFPSPIELLLVILPFSPLNCLHVHVHKLNTVDHIRRKRAFGIKRRVSERISDL